MVARRREPTSDGASVMGARALVLEGGHTFEGQAFGAPLDDVDATIHGEVVFFTGMVGYTETLTDPSYAGQILVLTYPLVGNYGVPSMDERDSFGIPHHFESERITIRALVVSECCARHSHWNAHESLDAWLKRFNVPGIHGVDTRMLTKRLRTDGTARGAVCAGGLKQRSSPDPTIATAATTNSLIASVVRPDVRVYNEGAHPRVVIIDCGMKYNLLRWMLKQTPPMEVRVVPWNFSLATASFGYDGLLISNGPGDPTAARETVETLRWAMTRASTSTNDPIPMLGVCLGHQLLALAAGARTYKMSYGHRGMNQPCLDLRTMRCYITPQNHGYAVDSSSLPDAWHTHFVNVNDGSNEGILHDHQPWMGVQFHPEACGGPPDTEFVLTDFVTRLHRRPPSVTVMDRMVGTQRAYKRVLLLGSGGLSIGQAGEFDYSGSQAIKALKEEGVEVVLMNPNIATVQTSRDMADRVYSLSIDVDTVTRVIVRERPDGILMGMGGQTALNVGVKLHHEGVLTRYDVAILGTPIRAIEQTEDRCLFAEQLALIGETVARSAPATSISEARRAADAIGYPILVRAAYALGGLGSGFATTPDELDALARRALTCSKQLLIDQDLRGWKEVEYEVVRDRYDNCIAVCNMENFDPLGVHTGDSIVVCPSQTLTNREYYMLRSASIRIVRHFGVIGECNVQFALSPHSEEYRVIEVNARLSRSSALASKATGYPLAYVATKLALGGDLARLPNTVTQTTSACFEPALDYCVVKVPRWDLAKFDRVSTTLGSAMMSVGEVMAIGRSFEETIQKAVRMVHPTLPGLVGSAPVERCLAEMHAQPDAVETCLGTPTDERLFAVCGALAAGVSVERVHELTRIDTWFLYKLHGLVAQWDALCALTPATLTPCTLRSLKRNGFSDAQIGRALNVGATMDVSEADIRRVRKAAGITPWIKQIDTLAAEFPACTNYLYTTYHGDEHDVTTATTTATATTIVGTCTSTPRTDALDDTGNRHPSGVIVLGCGAYCIGSSVEFDWCAVSAIRTLRRTGHAAIVINCNPETVSTDYDQSDRLYFDELSLERILDIYEMESAMGVVVSVGGQVPNTLALPLHSHGVRLLGTTADSIDRCEDRRRFSSMCDALGVKQPAWREVTTVDDACLFAQEVGYPVLVRPSYVLSGASMKVVYEEDQLKRYLVDRLFEGHPIDGHPQRNNVQRTQAVLSKYVLDAKEMEFDAVASNGIILNYALSEHVENAGVHSGDATIVLPAQKLYVETLRQVKRLVAQIAAELRISGPFNVQLMARDNDVQVIECNLRASRTFPFISKTFDLDFIAQATEAMLGMPVKRKAIPIVDRDYVGVKVAQFSFARLHGADPALGVEMMSTGEVACYAQDVHTAYLRALRATGFTLPTLPDRDAILLSIGSVSHKLELVDAVQSLVQMGYRLFGTAGTASFYRSRNIDIATVSTSASSSDNENPREDVLMMLRERRIHLVINIPNVAHARPLHGGGGGEDNDYTSGVGYAIRRTAVDFGVPMLTNVKTASLFCTALAQATRGDLPPLCTIGEMHCIV